MRKKALYRYSLLPIWLIASCCSTIAEPEPAPSLLDLAKQHFAPREFTPAEQELLRATGKGEPTEMYKKDEFAKLDPANADAWPKTNVVHADFLAWLCTDNEASKRVTYRGIWMAGVLIDGKLDLSFAQIHFPLAAWKCVFNDEIDLTRAHLQNLFLRFTRVKKVGMNGANIDAAVQFNDNFTAEDIVDLGAATIGGSLTCENGRFTHSKDGSIALNINSAKIGGSVFLNNGFRADGEVNLNSATIGGLFCENGQFCNYKGRALNADSVTIGNTVHLSHGFEAEGEVNFLGAIVGGKLDCTGAQFIHPADFAFFADGLEVRQSLVFSDTTIAGKVSLVATKVADFFTWHNIRPSDDTQLDLRSAKVGTLLDDKADWPLNGKLWLNGFIYDRISEDLWPPPNDRIDWLHRQPQDKFLPQPYEQLDSVLRTMGYEREARQLMLEKNRDHASFTKPLSEEWWWYNVFGWIIGYGYQPARAFKFSLAMIALGALLFRAGYRKGLLLPAEEKGFRKNKDGTLILRSGKPTFARQYPKFNALIFSLEAFTPFLKLDQSSNWAPNANSGMTIRVGSIAVKSGSLLRLYLWFHIMTGWLLTSLWVAGVTGLVKT